LLSAYLDNMLTAAERETLEKRLDADAFLRSELQAMRQTVAWLNQMPPLQAPRNFTISADDVAQDPPPKVTLMPRRNWWLSAAAAAVVIVIFGVVFITATLRPQNEQSPLG
jgi:anti-sigma factor RsiW